MVEGGVKGSEENGGDDEIVIVMVAVLGEVLYPSFSSI